jgi:hypothetical protein
MKMSKKFIILILIVIAVLGFGITATNYTTQQIMNYILSQTPDTTIYVRLAPDNNRTMLNGSVVYPDDVDTLDLKGYYSQRYKFQITTDVNIYLKILGAGNDSVLIKANESINMDYLHPLYDSMAIILPIDGAGSPANYRWISQGR